MAAPGEGNAAKAEGKPSAFFIPALHLRKTAKKLLPQLCASDYHPR